MFGRVGGRTISARVYATRELCIRNACGDYEVVYALRVRSRHILSRGLRPRLVVRQLTSAQASLQWQKTSRWVRGTELELETAQCSDASPSVARPPAARSAAGGVGARAAAERPCAARLNRGAIVGVQRHEAQSRAVLQPQPLQGRRLVRPPRSCHNVIAGRQQLRDFRTSSTW